MPEPSGKEKNSGRLVKFEANEVIIKEGSINSEMYKILKGNAELYTGYGTDQEVLIGIIGERKFFGEFGMLLGEPSIYTVVAFSEVYCMRVSADEMDEFIMENNSSVLDLLRNMAKSMVTMRTHIDLLTNDLIEASKMDAKKAEDNKKQTMREYALYRPGEIGLHGMRHALDMLHSGENSSEFDLKA